MRILGIICKDSCGKRPGMEQEQSRLYCRNPSKEQGRVLNREDIVLCILEIKEHWLKGYTISILLKLKKLSYKIHKILITTRMWTVTCEMTTENKYSPPRSTQGFQRRERSLTGWWVYAGVRGQDFISQWGQIDWNKRNDSQESPEEISRPGLKEMGKQCWQAVEDKAGNSSGQLWKVIRVRKGHKRVDFIQLKGESQGGFV